MENQESCKNNSNNRSKIDRVFMNKTKDVSQN